MARCVVLGANGFIGSHLVDELAAAGHTVRAFDRFGDPIIRYLPNDAIEKMAGNFLNYDDLMRAIDGMDYVFHFISTTTPVTAENDPLIDVETNIKMSIRLFDGCVKMGTKKLIFASTGGAVYGSGTTGPIQETALTQPISPYGIGKLTIEHYLRYFRTKHGLDSLVFRISNPYGERQPLHNKQGVIPIFLQHIAHDEPITVLGDGSMVRDYVYVGDVAHMVAMSFMSAKNTLYHLGSGQGVTVNEVVDAIKRIVGKDVKIEHKTAPSTFVDKVVLDVQRFQQEFGDQTNTSLDEGIRRTWDYVLRSRAEEMRA